MIRWNDSSLCIPRKMSSARAILSCDVCELTMTREKTEELSNKIADVVVTWNVHYKYHNASLLDKPFSGNCQDFMDFVFKKLDIKPQFSGALGNFLNNLKQKGEAGMGLALNIFLINLTPFVLEIMFTPDKKFADDYSILEGNRIFKSHLEIDLFVLSLLNINPNFAKSHPGEWTLLMSFDRAFWLRHFREPSNEDYIPHKCPFQTMQ